MFYRPAGVLVLRGYCWYCGDRTQKFVTPSMSIIMYVTQGSWLLQNHVCYYGIRTMYNFVVCFCCCCCFIYVFVSVYVRAISTLLLQQRGGGGGGFLVKNLRHLWLIQNTAAYLSLAHRRENTLLLFWKNCTGYQWDSELITKSCPWRTNATRVRRRNACRNSFPDIFLHDPFAHHRNPAYGFQVLLKNTAKDSLVSELFQTLSLPSFSATNSQESRFLGGVPQTFENPPVLLITLHRVFLLCLSLLGL